jgi:hypothetical protein
MTDNTKIYSTLKIESMDKNESNLEKCEKELIEKIFKDSEKEEKEDSDGEEKEYSESEEKDLEIRNANFSDLKRHGREDPYEGNLGQILRVDNRHGRIALDVDESGSGFFYSIEHEVVVKVLKEVVAIASAHQCKVSGKLLMLYDHNDIEDIDYFYVVDGVVGSGSFKKILEDEMEKKSQGLICGHKCNHICYPKKTIKK